MDLGISSWLLFLLISSINSLFLSVILLKNGNAIIFESVFDCFNFIIFQKDFENFKKVMLSDQQQLLLEISKRDKSEKIKSTKENVNKICSLIEEGQIVKNSIALKYAPEKLKND